MAVAFDAKGSASQNNVSAVTSFTYTLLTIGALSNTVLAVFVSFGANPGTVTAHWDSTGANQLMTQVVTQNATTNDAYTYILGRIAPTTGNRTLSVSWTNASDYCVDAASFTGADQGSVAGTFRNTVTKQATDLGNNTQDAITIASAVNDIAIAGWASNGILLDTTGITGTNIFVDNTAVSAAADYIAGASSVSPSIRDGNNPGSWVAVGCSIAAVGTVGTVTLMGAMVM